MVRNWLQQAIKREGRVKNYLRRVYGSRAFNKDGTIKSEYIRKALKRIEKKPTPNEKSLKAALNLALRLKRMARKRTRRRRTRRRRTRRTRRRRRR